MGFEKNAAAFATLVGEMGVIPFIRGFSTNGDALEWRRYASNAGPGHVNMLWTCLAHGASKGMYECD